MEGERKIFGKMMKRFAIMSITTMAIAFIIAIPVFAVPANPAPFTVTQPDGTKVTLSHRGDEWFDFFITDENKLAIRDGEVWRYVEKDGADGLRLGGLIGGKAPENALDSGIFADERARESYALLNGKSYDLARKREQSDPLTISRLEKRDREAGILSVNEDMKTLPLVTIVVSFNNIGYSTEHYWNAPLYGEDNSLQDYYSDMSNGKFTFVPVEETCSNLTISGNEQGEMNLGEDFDNENDGIIHVTVDRAHEDWSVLNPTTDPGIQRQHRMYEAMDDALEVASQYMDFASYDDDKDGKISDDELGISFILAGIEAASVSDVFSSEELESCGIANDYLTWAHQGWFYNGSDISLEIDGVVLRKYIVISDFMADDRPKDFKVGDMIPFIQESLGVVYHELGHYIGLPDLYDTEYASLGEWTGYKVGDLSLMDSGSWSTDGEGNKCPADLDAWSRFVLEWVAPTEVKEDGTYSLNSQRSDEGYNMLLIDTENEDEYYLLENRQPEGYDRALDDYGVKNGDENAYNSGIVIWHIDDAYYKKYKDDNKVNVVTHHPAIMPLYAEYRVPFTEGDHAEYALDFVSTSANSAYPFYSKESFSYLFNDAEGFDDGLILPIYGTGDQADLRDGRTLSDISLNFPTGSAREMEVDIKVEPIAPITPAEVPITKIITEEEKKLLDSDGVTAASKNGILKRVDAAIDDEIMKDSLVCFNSAIKGTGKNSSKEYWVQISMNTALRYDGRSHVLSSSKASKSKNPDFYAEVLYCEKTGKYAETAPPNDVKAENGVDGWTKAEVKSVKLKNAKDATVGYDGVKLGSVKGLSKSAYLSGIALKDKELNKTLGKAVNQKLKELSKNIKNDKSSSYTVEELDSDKATEEQQLIIPIYPAFIGLDSQESATYKTIDGNEKTVELTITPGSLDSAKNKIKGAKLEFKYDGGLTKTFKLKFKSGEITGSKLFAEGNYFGAIDY